MQCVVTGQSGTVRSAILYRIESWGTYRAASESEPDFCLRDIRRYASRNCVDRSIDVGENVELMSIGAAVAVSQQLLGTSVRHQLCAPRRGGCTVTVSLYRQCCGGECYTLVGRPYLVN
jgi:hypothetical protein